jgi:hypothetical protein
VKTDSRYFVDEFKSELHLSASNYNKNYAHFYIAAELAGIDSEWYFLLDSDELLTHKTLQRLELILKQNQPDEYYVAALPTQLFSRYINGKSSVPAYTPFVVYSHKSFHLLQGNRGFIIPPMTE